jgi:hypothetical protein
MSFFQRINETGSDKTSFLAAPMLISRCPFTECPHSVEM